MISVLKTLGSKSLVFLVVFALLLTGVPDLVGAAGGSYSLNFSAANPADDGTTYPKVTPDQQAPVWGRADDDPLANSDFGSPKDSVESLMPKDMMLGQIVPYDILISVNGSTEPENGVIEFSAYWLTKTTNGGDFGYDPTYMVYGAFVKAADPAHSEIGGTPATVDHSLSHSSLAFAGTNNEQIQGTIRVTGLDDGDSVVVQV